MGLAFSAKLLPSALLARGRSLPGSLGAADSVPRCTRFRGDVFAIVLLPFILWDPAGFVSATLLFYLTHHAAGDTTSLWYYLPKSLRLPFQAAGRSRRSLLVALSPLRSRSEDQRDLMRAMVVASLLFLASSPMIHLNYQFAVVPLACVALVRRRHGAAARGGSRAEQWDRFVVWT